MEEVQIKIESKDLSAIDTATKNLQQTIDAIKPLSHNEAQSLVKILKANFELLKDVFESSLKVGYGISLANSSSFR